MRRNDYKEYEMTFTIGRIYDATGLTKKEVKEIALDDFYDDARHGALNPSFKMKLRTHVKVKK
jgi:hypothetical protein